jgi:hypothetical protein
MPRQSDISVSDLLLDQKNARLGDEQPSQQATIHALASQQGRRLVKLAENIVANGLDPAQLFTVVATSDKKRGYVVLEGNRRTLALKALETPTIVQSALQPGDFKKLLTLADRFTNNPIESVQCVLYDPSEQSAAVNFVMSRHGGAQEGIGLVEWDSDEKDRFRVRHGVSAVRAYSGQVLDFIDELDGSSDTKARISTTLQRILKSRPVQNALGLEVTGGELVTRYPVNEVAKGLRKVVDDLRTQRVKVPDVYDDALRQAYIQKFTPADLPDPKTKLAAPTRLIDLPKGTAAPLPAKPKRTKSKPKPPRTSVAASDAKINPSPQRINSVYNELVTLNADTYPNAGSVLFRVFVELSVDDYVTRHALMTEEQRRNNPLAKRLKAANDHLRDAGAIAPGLHKAVEQVANSKHGLAAGLTTLNQYVHNSYSFPKPSELRTSWDELQPFLEAIWK